MVKYHPFQQVYFSELVVSPKHNELVTKYELEYWGCGFFQALTFLAETDNSDTIRILGNMEPVANNLLLLKPAQRARFKVVTWGQVPYYVVTSYRAGSYLDMDGRYPKVYQVDVLNNTILGVYKVDNEL
jgi:hypothetical protein